MYQQTLYKILPNHIKSKVLKRNNRYKKWETGYNEEYDIIIISKTGQIGDRLHCHPCNILNLF